MDRTQLDRPTDCKKTVGISTPRRFRHVFLTMLMGLVAGSLLNAQQQEPKKYPTAADAQANLRMTIPEHVARHGSYSMGGFETYVYYNTFDELLQASDIVIKGQVVSLTPRLSENERKIVTDAEITLDEVLYPGNAKGIRPNYVTFTLLGGTLQLPNGRAEWKTELREPMRFGHRYMFFLERMRPDAPESNPRLAREGIRQWQLVGEAQGVFEIINGKMLPLSRGEGLFNEALGMDYEEFASRVIISARKLQGSSK